MADRPRRAIAGANMAKLMTEEDKGDDFYKTAYGGFEEDETDGDYSTEKEVSDLVDTDFDLSEEPDEVASGEEGEEERRKRRKWEVKPPPPRAAKPKEQQPQGGEKKERKTQPTVVLQVSRRSTTAVKSEISKVKRDHDAKSRAKRKPVKREWKMPSQEEIMEECRVTEERNLELLHAFRLHEEQRKKSRATKRRATMGAYIRYHSIAAPIVKLGGLTASSPQHGSHPGTDHKVTNLRYCTRNFVTFSDPRIVPQCLQKSTNKVNIPEKLYCPVTRLPAKYIDPLTGTPYASSKAFKMIRDSFAAYEEVRHDQGTGSADSGSKRNRKKANDND